MPNRTTDLLNIRPEIHDAIVFETMSDDERFQNTTIRPVIKLQHDLLIEVFKNHSVACPCGIYCDSVLSNNPERERYCTAK